MSKRFLCYNTEDAEAGKVPVGSNGCLNGYDFIIDVKLYATTSSEEDIPAEGTLVHGDYDAAVSKMMSGKPVVALVREYFLAVGKTDATGNGWTNLSFTVCTPTYFGYTGDSTAPVAFAFQQLGNCEVYVQPGNEVAVSF